MALADRGVWRPRSKEAKELESTEVTWFERDLEWVRGNLRK